MSGVHFILKENAKVANCYQFWLELLLQLLLKQMLTKDKAQGSISFNFIFQFNEKYRWRKIWNDLE